MSADNESGYWLNKDGYNFAEHRYKYGILEDEHLALSEKREMQLFAMLKPKFGVDDGQYFVLLGEDLQSGICGFGDTLILAIRDFNAQFHKKANQETKANWIAKF